MSADRPAPTPSELRATAARVAATSARLRALGADRVARSLASAARILADATTTLGAEARATLPRATGLSPPMIDWALATALGGATPDQLLRLAPPSHRSAAAIPARLACVVLAGNVFTAAYRAVAMPLMAGAPTVAKAPSSDDTFPRLLERALREADEEVAGSFAVGTFEGGDEDREQALLSQADAVAVYGGDATVSSIRARLPASVDVIAHGHGLGIGYACASALDNETRARSIAERFALDVAAYDQRGCFSPHAIWMEHGAAVDARSFARTLAEHGLRSLATTLPRGALPVEAGAAQVQWRGVAAARGELFEGDGFAVSFEGKGTLRLSPGFRNVALLECASIDELCARIAPLGRHLKAIGVAGAREDLDRVARALPAPLAPRICAAGQMQTPSLPGRADGLPPWHGLIRWAEVE